MKFNKRKSKKELQYPQILQLDDDFSLIQKFIEGDESTFKTLVQRHKDMIRNIIYLMLNSSDSVDDVAQDVLITVYKNLKNFRFESQFSTWLYRITVNKCKDHLRKVKIRSIFTPITNDGEHPSYTPPTENKDVSEIVRAAISQLPLIRLRAAEPQSCRQHTEIASPGMSSLTTKSESAVTWDSSLTAVKTERGEEISIQIEQEQEQDLSPTQHEILKKPWKYLGYPVYAKFIASDDDFYIFRRFEDLNVRALLSLQDQVVVLEGKLNALDDQHSRKKSPDVDNGTFRNDLTERAVLLDSITEKLQQYSKKLTQNKQRGRNLSMLTYCSHARPLPTPDC